MYSASKVFHREKISLGAIFAEEDFRPEKVTNLPLFPDKIFPNKLPYNRYL